MTVTWPQHLILELTNACDLACRHCHFHGEGVVKTRPTGAMDEALWRAALAEAASWNTELTVQPWGMGESLLYPRFWDVVETAKSHDGLKVGFYSNGMQWKAADYDAAIDSGLDWVCFSVDGLDAHQFAQFRDGACLDKVIETIEGLAAAREARGATTPRIRINMVAYSDLSSDVNSFVERWRGLADSVMVSRFRPVGSRRFSPVEIPRVPCYQLDSILAVAWDGQVAMCCEDPQVSDPIGTFPQTSLTDLWNGERLTEVRAAHRAGHYAISELCKDCDAWTGVYSQDRHAPGTVVTERTAGSTYELTNPE